MQRESREKEDHTANSKRLGVARIVSTRQGIGPPPTWQRATPAHSWKALQDRLRSLGTTKGQQRAREGLKA